MALETGTYISDLVATNPAAGDGKAQGDDHLRLIKSTIKATFPNVTGVVTATHTQLNATPLTNGTAVASTSGTAIDFTSIPSATKRITVMFYGVSLNGNAAPRIQIGDSGGIETTGYINSKASGIGGTFTVTAGGTSGFDIETLGAADAMHGAITLALLDAATNTWVASGNVVSSGSSGMYFTTGSKPLSTTLDRVRITTAAGTATFDAGLINIQYD